MDKGIYTALSGGIAKSHELELIANNLANANTASFKRDTGTFNEYLTELRHPDSVEGLPREIDSLTNPNARPSGDKSFVEMDGVYTDFRQGTLMRTGRSLDVAVEGEGFFEVLTPQGIRYTRQGNFSVNPEGKLVSSNGYPVLARPTKGQAQMAAGGGFFSLLGIASAAKRAIPVRDPSPAERMITLKEGPVNITEEGNIMQNGVTIAAINIEEFNENQWLEKVGNSYYKNITPENLKNSPMLTKLHQGYMEGSNVNAVAEMTRLIEATRSYESHMQAIKTYQDIDAKSVNDIAKER